MKTTVEIIRTLEIKNSGTDYDINKLFLSELKQIDLIEMLSNEEITLVSLQSYDQIIYTDKLNWMEFIYAIKDKTDKVNYIDSCDNYHYDKFRDLIQEKPGTLTISYDEQIDLGMVRYDFDKIVLFDKAHANEIKKMLNGKVEAYVLPKYDKQIIDQIINELD